jgi:preprotein translocase subunit YajC
MTASQQNNNETRNSAIAAALILVVFGALFYFMPIIMLAVGPYSHVLAALIAIVFVMAFFAVFWLRAKAQKKRQH